MDLAELSLPEIDKVLQTYPWFSLARREFYLRMVSLGDEYRQEGLKKSAVYVFSREGLLKEGQKIKIASNRQDNSPAVSEVTSQVFSLEDTDFVEPDAPPAPIAPVPVVAVPEAQEEVQTPFVVDNEDVLPAEDFSPEPVFTLDTPSENETHSPEPEEEASPEQTVPQVRKEIHVIGGDYFSKEDFDTLQNDGMSTLERFNTISRPDDPKSSNFPDDPNAEFTDEDYYTETLARIYSQQSLYKKAIEVYSKLILLYPEKSTYFAALIDEQKKYL